MYFLKIENDEFKLMNEIFEMVKKLRYVYIF